MAFEHLSAKGRIGNLEIKNRLVMTAMGVGVGDHSGIASDGFIEFYRKRAEGGVGGHPRERCPRRLRIRSALPVQ